MSKQLTIEQIRQQAEELGIAPAALQAIHEVECRGSGFNPDNTPVILFERHKHRSRLIANKFFSIAEKWKLSALTFVINHLVLMAYIQLSMVD